MLHTQVLLHPALLADLHRIVRVSVHVRHRRRARTCLAVALGNRVRVLVITACYAVVAQHATNRQPIPLVHVAGTHRLAAACQIMVVRIHAAATGLRSRPEVCIRTQTEITH